MLASDVSVKEQKRSYACADRAGPLNVSQALSANSQPSPSSSEILDQWRTTGHKAAWLQGKDSCSFELERNLAITMFFQLCAPFPAGQTPPAMEMLGSFWPKSSMTASGLCWLEGDGRHLLPLPDQLSSVALDFALGVEFPEESRAEDKMIRSREVS